MIMEPINFYNNGSPKQYKAISRWFCMSSIALATLGISIACMHMHQWYSHSSLQEEKSTVYTQLRKYDHIAAYHQNQKTLEEKLEKKAQFQQQQSKNQKNAIELLRIVKTALKHDVSLESLSFDAHHLELKIASEKTKTLVQCADAIGQKSAYADLAITALECKEKNRILATIKNS